MTSAGLVRKDCEVGIVTLDLITEDVGNSVDFCTLILVKVKVCFLKFAVSCVWC